MIKNSPGSWLAFGIFAISVIEGFPRSAYAQDGGFSVSENSTVSSLGDLFLVGETRRLPAGQRQSSPLEHPPGRLFNFETANQLPANALELTFGAHFTLFEDSPGTGNQLFYGNAAWGVTDNLELGLAYQNYDDPIAASINGASPNLTLLSIAPSIQYRFLEADNLSLGVQGSVEWLSFSTELFDTDDSGSSQVVGSLYLPATYTVSPELQVHLTPGVVFFPGRLSGFEFYDTVFTIGAGASWQPSERWLLYSALNLPLGPGGNTINDDQSIGRRLVWTVGSRFNVTPKVSLNLYATNGFGTTPATQILTTIPEGNKPQLGLQLNYTPDLGLGYSSTYRDEPLTPLSDRDRQLLLDGFTLTSASTLEPGQVALGAGGGTQSNYWLSATYSPDQDLQVEAILEDYGSSDSVSSADTAGDSLRYMVGAKVRLFDQVQGDFLSLSARLLGGRDFDSDSTIGVIYGDVPMTYQVNDQTALMVNPRLAAFGDDVTFGLGFGINQEVADGWQLIGEVTPVFGGGRLVWAAGTRYSFTDIPLNLDLYTTNALGSNTLGTLVGESGLSLGAALHWIFGN